MNSSRLPQVLAVDDDPSVLSSLAVLFEGQYNFVSAQTAQDALKFLNDIDIHVAILDIGLPDMNGIALLKRVKEINPAIEAVMLTADTALVRGVEAMKAGAFDYLVKPFDVDQLSIVVRNAAEKVWLTREVRYHRIKNAEKPKTIIGQSAPMQVVFKTIGQLAQTDATVLIIGESGTGKELVAQAIHNASDRQDGPFVAVNCGAIPNELMESELFGHEKGAFTGAAARKPGRFELAHRGTLFLDEISTLPLPLQTRLLRVLQEKTIERVGGTHSIAIDARIIAATNVDPKELIKKGQFREDLYYRLNVVPLSVPPLRERKDDIPLLVKYFLNLYNKEYHRQVKDMSPQVMKYFNNYAWRGNVRELENIIQRLLVISSGTAITINELPMDVIKDGISGGYISDNQCSLEKSLTQFELDYIKQTLLKTNNNRQEAAQLLGVHRNTLLNRMKALGLLESDVKRL